MGENWLFDKHIIRFSPKTIYLCRILFAFFGKLADIGQTILYFCTRLDYFYFRNLVIAPM